MAKTLDAICPSCGGTTDTGGECNDCPFDWQDDKRTEKQKFTDEWTRLAQAGTKNDMAAFLKHNQYGSIVSYNPY